jgi:hypothetical protein
VVQPKDLFSLFALDLHSHPNASRPYAHDSQGLRCVEQSPEVVFKDDRDKVIRGDVDAEFDGDTRADTRHSLDAMLACDALADRGDVHIGIRWYPVLHEVTRTLPAFADEMLRRRKQVD